MIHPHTPQVAVITPTTLAPARRDFLLDLYRSLTEQTMTRWQWILAPNGTEADPSQIPDEITQDPRVQISPRPRPGAAPARNLALNLVNTAPYTVFCDDDDAIPPASLAVRLHHAEKTGLGWVAGWSADLQDGKLTTWTCPTPIGRHEAGDVWTYWASPRTKPPIGHTMLLTRTELARASGGFAGLWKGEDYAYCMAVTGRSAGELLPEVVYHYRRNYGDQMTEHPEYRDADEYGARTFAYRMGQAERKLRAQESFEPLHAQQENRGGRMGIGATALTK